MRRLLGSPAEMQGSATPELFPRRNCFLILNYMAEHRCEQTVYRLVHKSKFVTRVPGRNMQELLLLSTQHRYTKPFAEICEASKFEKASLLYGSSSYIPRAFLTILSQMNPHGFLSLLIVGGAPRDAIEAKGARSSAAHAGSPSPRAPRSTRTLAEELVAGRLVCGLLK